MFPASVSLSVVALLCKHASMDRDPACSEDCPNYIQVPDVSTASGGDSLWPLPNLLVMASSEFICHTEGVFEVL